MSDDLQAEVERLRAELARVRGNAGAGARIREAARIGATQGTAAMEAYLAATPQPAPVVK